MNKEQITRLHNLIAECIHTHEDIDNTLYKANKILNGYGVESINHNMWDNYYCDIGLLYVNMGDTYTTTLVYDTYEQEFYITSWGDIVEQEQDRFDI